MTPINRQVLKNIFKLNMVPDIKQTFIIMIIYYYYYIIMVP